MRRAIGCLLALTLVLSGASACSSGSTPITASPSELGNGWQPDQALALAYATQFHVEFFAGDGGAPCPLDDTPEMRGACEARQYALVTISDGSRYMVVPEDKPSPQGIASDIVVLKRPLTNLYVAASATMSLFVALDGLSSVKFSSLKADGWYVPEAKQAMEAGQILFGGKYSAPDYELILKSAPSLAIENGMISHSPEVKEKLISLGIPVLQEQSSYEAHPLGRTEWIKLIGVLLGKEALAETLFAEQAAHLDELVGQESTGKTVAFFFISSAGYAVARKSGDYIPKMIQLAGGDYIFNNLGDDTATSTVNLEMEQFYATAKNADYIIYNSTIGGELGSMADLTALNPLLKDFRAVQSGNVWCTGKDFYQDMTGLGQMITDMHQMLTDPDPPDQLTFLHRLR